MHFILIYKEPKDKAGALDQLHEIGFRVQVHSLLLCELFKHKHKQGFLGDLASFLESIKNVFNFSVPFLSWLVFVVLILLTIFLYLLPIRYSIVPVTHPYIVNTLECCLLCGYLTN